MSKVNFRYKYIDQDISSILHIKLRNENLKELKNIFTIAPVGENESILVKLLNEERKNNKSSPNRTLLIPYLIGSNEDGHWVGVLIDFENNVAAKIEYYDSLVNRVTDKLIQDLKQIYGDDVSNKIDEKRDNIIRQKDYSSCGPCMIENLVNAAKKAHNVLSLHEIRKNHLLLMRNEPGGEDFYRRQLHDNYGVDEEIDTSQFISNDCTLSARQCVDDGNSLLKRHNFSEAINKYDKAIKKCPYYAVPYYNKRIALSLQRDFIHKSPLRETILSDDSPKPHLDSMFDRLIIGKSCDLASQSVPYFVISTIAFVPEHRFSDDSSTEEVDEEFDKLHQKSIDNNEWPFTTRRKKNTKIKTVLRCIDSKLLCGIQDTAKSKVVYPLLSKFSENGFGTCEKDKLSTIAVSVGLNRMHSLSTRKNYSLILELKRKVYTKEIKRLGYSRNEKKNKKKTTIRKIKYRKFGYFWECFWYTKYGKEANIEDVRMFYKQLKSKDPKLARRFIEQEEEAAECNVPYQLIREYSKNHPDTIELIKGFRDKNHDAIIYLHLVDADVLDFNKVYSAYLRILDGCYEPPTIMSTGYEFPKDPQNMAYYLLGHMERMHRVITTFHIPLGTYYPEPNMCVLIPRNCETVEERFIDRNRGNGRSLESPILINNIQNNRQYVFAIFSADNPIITSIPSRFKVSKQTKKLINFSSEFNNGPAAPTSDDIKKYTQVSQSHSNTLTWSQSLFINNGIKYDKGYGTDDECIYNKKHTPLKGVDKQCKYLIGNICKGEYVEKSRSKLANCIGKDNEDDIVNAMEDINQFDKEFDEKFSRTAEEQELIDLLKEREVFHNNLSRKSLLLMINSSIIDSIRDNTIDVHRLIMLDEEILHFILNNNKIIEALRDKQIDFNDLEDCLTDDDENFNNIVTAIGKGYSVNDIFKKYQEDPLHLDFMGAWDPASYVHSNSENEEIVHFAIDHDYIDEDDIDNIKSELMGDRDDFSAAYMDFDAMLLRRENNHDNHDYYDHYNDFNDYNDHNVYNHFNEYNDSNNYDNYEDSNDNNDCGDSDDYENEENEESIMMHFH